ncbi:MAG: hypothetical protein Kow0098_20020 [Ignavibacteriaceae bacterium]
MRKNTYESAVIINAALEDDQIEQILSRIRETITGNGGEIREIENWGRKRLAYMIKKNKIGYYVFFRFDAPPSIVGKLDRLYSLDEQIIRYLTIRLSADALEHIEKSKTAASTSSDSTVTEPVLEATTEESTGTDEE